MSNTLRIGFLEKVYENALAHELRKAGFAVNQQHNISVYYDDVIIGRLHGGPVGRKRGVSRTESRPGLGTNSQSPMPELPESDGPATLPAYQFRQPAPRDQTGGQQPLTVQGRSGFVSVHLRAFALKMRCQSTPNRCSGARKAVLWRLAGVMRAGSLPSRERIWNADVR